MGLAVWDTVPGDVASDCGVRAAELGGMGTPVVLQQLMLLLMVVLTSGVSSSQQQLDIFCLRVKVWGLGGSVQISE